jgi:thiamine-monophosphate kinase
MRSGALPGDHIFVTGDLGGASIGLRLLESGAYRMRSPGERRLAERAVRRQRRPEPRLSWASLLGEEGLATAMIDISDGLSSDLAHLCHASRVGARIDARRIPVDKAVINLCPHFSLNPLDVALGGGEDFELLFTISPLDLARLPKRVGDVRATYIGDVTDDSRIIIYDGRDFRRLRPTGFEHFY